MADNDIELLDDGGNTQFIAADEIGGVKFQRVKLVWGADNSAADASAAAPLPVVDSALAGYVDGLEALATSLNSYVDGLEGYQDGLEGLVGTTNTSLTTLAGYVDGLEALATTLNGYVDGLEALGAASLPAGTNNIGDVDVLTLPALPAGTNAIGKLAANSGVDIGDVDVTSLPATPAGTNLIGMISAVDETSTIYAGTAPLTPKFIPIDHAVSGDNTLVAAVNPKKIRVLSVLLVAAAAVTVRFESGAGGTALTGQMNVIANGGFVLPFNPKGWFETASNTLLNLELSGAVSVDGCLSYVEV